MNTVWINDWAKNPVTNTIPAKNDSILASNIINNSNDNDNLSSSKNAVRYYVVSSVKNALFENVSKIFTLYNFSYIHLTSFDYFPENIPDTLEDIIICDDNLDKIGDCEVLFKYIDAGKKAIFATTLDTASESYKKISARLGIDRTLGQQKHEKMDFNKGILISGLYFDADVDITSNNVKLNGKTKIYASAFAENAKNYYERPPIIWRIFYGEGPIYVINADLLEDFSYAGVLTGLLGLNKDVFIYPIVNSGNIIIDSLPFYSNESSGDLSEAYNRDIVQLQRDTIWSDMVSLLKRIDVKSTFFPYVGTEMNFYEKELREFYAKEISMNEFELGFYPSDNFGNIFKNLIFSAELNYTDETANKITYDTTKFGYESNDKIYLPISGKGHDLTKGDIFKNYSFASAFGYINHYIDMKQIFLSNSKTDLWSDYKIKLVQSLYSFTKTYEYLDFETISFAGERMSIFLNLEPEYEISSSAISIKGTDLGQTSYILRLNGSIIRSQNCSVEKIGEEFYHIKVYDNDAQIYIKSD